ncbi:MAG: ThuA domain-containing protein [Clostridia bacterium]|nr:ThuA domain-containing protein [Clostridia bacterium]
MSIRVTVFNEYLHETFDEKVRGIYPDGIHGTIAAFLKEADFSVTTATQNMEEHGLTEEVLASTDVLIWWAHLIHDKVSDEVVERVYERVMEGMGLIVLHSGHASKIFRKLMGTHTERLRWRESDDKEILYVVNPSHDIVNGLADHIVIPHEETYGEYFDIPEPEEQIFISWYEGGEVFRSGCTWRRGKGKIFYFKPGHESYPIYHMKEIQKIICNAVLWAAPKHNMTLTEGHTPIPMAEKK